MTSSELSAKLRGGESVFGTLIVSASPIWPKAVKGTGLDFVFIDTEHIPLGRAEVSWMCQTYAALGLPPIVRIPSPDPYSATKALDGGAAGIVAPYVETVEQAKALRGAVECRPLKGSVLADHLDGRAPFAGELAGYVEKGNRNNVLILNIESVPAINSLDKILAVPEIDAILIGPHDLSCSLGVPEQYGHPKFEEAVRAIFRKARRAGVGAGIHAFYSNVPQESSWITDGGANLLIHSANVIAFAKSMAADIAHFRKAVGGGQVSKADAINI